MSLSSYNRALAKESLSSESIDFPAFRELYHSTVRLLNEITMIPRQKIVLTRYFEKESKNMSGILQSIGELVDKMKAEINGSGALKRLDDVKRMLDDFKGIEDGISSSNKGLEDLDSRIKQKKAELDGLREELAGIEKSPEWGELEGFEKNINGHLKRKDEIESEMSGELGALKRVFKLYSHDADGLGLGKEARKLVMDLSKSPLKTFLSSDAGALRDVLKRMKDDIGRGNFRLSEKDGGKASHIDSLLGSDRIVKARDEHRDVLAGLEELRKRKGGIKVAAEKGEHGRLLERTETELAVLEREKADIEAGLREKQSQLDDKRKAISDYIRKEFGRAVELQA
jgi:predicted  nucleic acid-binding Zn-ribbon protein